MYGHGAHESGDARKDAGFAGVPVLGLGLGTDLQDHQCS